ncbi:MAG: type III pantothenate kinase, partial [Pseudomonadota bacterium]
MLLAIDVGNTNTVFAVFRDGTPAGEWRCNTERVRTADQYYVWLSQLMEHGGLSPREIRNVVISNVAPDTLFNLRVLCDRYFDTRPLVVGKPECDLPVPVRVDNPSEVGGDRLVNTVAAHNRHGGNLIVVDFGTATTFDVVAEDGAYEGGVIAPGVNLSLDALHGAAAHLPRIDVTKPQAVLGRNTVACMQSGIYWGYVGLIEGICAR